MTGMRRLAGLALVAVALVAAQASEAQVERYRFNVQKLPPRVQTLLKERAWRPGCPVPLSGLRLVTVTHWGFDGKARLGRLVVHRDAAVPFTRVFRRLHELRFPIRHMQLDDLYGPKSARPAGGDVTGSFFCREAVPSPCSGGTRTGTWSNHAYGLAIDVNPVENPYVGCGMSRDPAAQRYLDRTRLRKGMVTPAVVRAFRSIGWGWGGDWSGQTKDYMHFSHNGR
jgi:hypothetical protein